MQPERTFNRARAGPMVLVALIHGLIAWAFIAGLALTVVKPKNEELKTFDVTVPAPPAEEPPAAPKAPSESELVAPTTPLPAPASPAAAPLTAGPSDGRASGTAATGAIWRSGSFSNESDYPDAARRREEQGTVRVRFTVGTDGRVSGCSVVASSGSSALDSTTCRILQRRFRYRPARDSSGNPVPETKTQAVTWRLT